MGRRISGHPATAKGSGSGNEPLFNLNFKNPLTKARVAQAFSGIQQAVSSATDIAHAINDMGDKPSLRNYAALGVVVLNKILGSTTFDPNEDERFVALELMYVLKDSIAKVYSTFPGVKLIGSGDKRYQVCELGDGYMLVFSLGEGGEVSTTYMLGPEGMTEKMEIPRVGQGLWKQLGTRIEVLIPTTMLDDSMPGDLKAWKPKELFGSAQTDEVYTTIRAYLDKGHTRGIVLQGLPGAGKSCMVQSIVDRLSMTTLILDHGTMRGIGTWGIAKLLEILEPEVLVIDDLDRLPFLEQFLGLIDRVREKVKLLLVTMNHEEELDAAVVRTGRFDQVVPVIRVCDPVEQLPSLPASVIDEVGSWPVSTIRELAIRLDVEGMDSLDRQMADLRERVRRNMEAKAKKATKAVAVSDEDDD